MHTTGAAQRLRGATVLALLALLADRSLADCGPGALAAARAAADAECNCATAASHRSYVRCVTEVARAAVANGTLAPECRRSLRRCASRSTCGRPGTVTCCRTSPSGRVRCGVRRSVEACERRLGAVASTCTSCCDACGGGQCPAASTTTTSDPATSTTTASAATSTSTSPLPTSTTAPGGTTSTTTPRCGNGTLDPGEECDPPGSLACPQGSAGGALLECGQSCDCPVPTTTTSSTTSSTSSSTSTSTIPCDCCGFGRLSLETTPGAGSCGTLTSNTGVPLLSLTCGSLYVGGGSGAVPPAPVPDMGRLNLNLSACDPVSGNMTLAATTSAETGSNRSCSAVGCLFGAPLPIPNPNTIATSTCVINSLAAPASGAANCRDGSYTISLPLNADVFLTADLLPFEPGIQPCPICTPGGGCPTGICCKGGLNDGRDCTPASSDLGDAFPTSHDCPPPAVLNIGTLAIPFVLTTGASVDTAVRSGLQTRVFCGFCRDSDQTNGFGLCAGGAFDGAPCARHEDCGGGMRCGGVIPCGSDADCGLGDDPRESCEQKNNGAFGKANAQTITELGSASGTCLDTGLPQPVTGASAFCIPPTFDPTVDGAADLPGPGAASLPGNLRLVVP